MRSSFTLGFLAIAVGAGFTAAQECNAEKYCAFSYNNNNCAITTWACDCEVPLFYECAGSSFCSGSDCVNNLCCHTENLPNGSSDCPTTDELTACGYSRTIGTGSSAAWVPPYTEIPDALKCGC